MTLFPSRLPGLLLLTLVALGGCSQTLTVRTDGGDPGVVEREPATIADHDLAGPWRAAPKGAGTADPATRPATGDVWARMRRGFTLEIPSNPRVQRETDWYAAHPAYIERVQERARPYLRYIVDQVAARGLPMELALLPVVESAYQPFAYSHGRAAGLWQFIPSTGKHFGLKQNWWYDGRRDIVASTEAALDYLDQLARRFDGDWELALAAYNSGAGTVSRAIRKNRTKGRPTDFWSLDLPRETSGYVPRLLAITRVVRDPAAFGVSLAPLPDEQLLQPVDIGSQLDLAMAAEMAGLSIDELYQLNPGFNRWATDPDGPHRLLLPVEQVERFTAELAALPREERVRWQRYRIRRGDNLGSIARRHHTTVALLQQVNGLKSSRIRAGRHLLIPVASRSHEGRALASNQAPATGRQRESAGGKTWYRVRSGDSLWAISRRYGVDHRELAEWNGLSPGGTLRTGARLEIRSPDRAADPAPYGLPPDLDAPINTLSRVNYRVRSGDSLFLIARKFNVRVADLRRWNTLSGRYLQPGQTLRLYVDVAEQAL
jgi:membrane-bound lytic murein transglycosylase D